MSNDVRSESSSRPVEDDTRRLLQDAETASAYLRASFLGSVADMLWSARQQAGATQSDIAEKLGTKQSAIARWEADTSGAISLRRFVDYCVACGVFPFDPNYSPLATIIEFSKAHPIEKRTETAVAAWQEVSRRKSEQAEAEGRATDATVAGPLSHPSLESIQRDPFTSRAQLSEVYSRALSEARAAQDAVKRDLELAVQELNRAPEYVVATQAAALALESEHSEALSKSAALSDMRSQIAAYVRAAGSVQERDIDLTQDSSIGLGIQAKSLALSEALAASQLSMTPSSRDYAPTTGVTGASDQQRAAA